MTERTIESLSEELIGLVCKELIELVCKEDEELYRKMLTRYGSAQLYYGGEPKVGDYQIENRLEMKEGTDDILVLVRTVKRWNGEEWEIA